MAQKPGRLRKWVGKLRGGLLWALLGSALVLVLPLFLVGAGLLVYLIFPPAPLDLVILGVDARAGEGYLTRTDSVMVMGVSPANLNVSLLSIPRDIFINTPGYGLQRINTINVLGEQDQAGSGGMLVQQALASSFPMQPDRYMRVNFDGFKELIDALGGITIDVPRRIVDYEYPTDDFGTTTMIFEEGRQVMDGERALAYARTRHADDDYRRAERQQQVLFAIFRASLNPLNWPRVPVATGTFFQHIDTNMSLWDMLAIAPPVLLDGASGGIDKMVITRDLLQYTANGNALPNYELLNPWVEDHFH